MEPLIQAGKKAVSAKGSRKKLLARALEDPANYHHALPVLCAISKKFEALHKGKEDIYNSTTDKELRKAMVKQLPLAERMAKSAFTLFPQYTVQPSHLNFNSEFAPVLLRAMGFQPPKQCCSDNMLWFSSFVLNGCDHVYPNLPQIRATELRAVPEMIVTATQMDKAMREWNGSCKKVVVRITSTGRTLHVFTRQLVQTDRSRKRRWYYR